MANDSSTAASPEPVNGFILAGGQSRRMGTDKASLLWRGQPLLVHMTHVLSTAADAVRVVGRGALPDAVANCGPLGGILTALETTGTERNLILGVDLPLITPEFLMYLKRRALASGKPVVACRIGGQYPLCLSISRAALPNVAERIARGRLAVHGLIEALGPEVLTEAEINAAGFDSSIFRNVNTPEEWSALLSSLP